VQTSNSAHDPLLQKVHTDALFLRAQIAQSELRFSEAADSLLLWLKQPPEGLASSTLDQALQLIWAAGPRKELQAWIETSKACSGPQQAVCERIESLLALTEPSIRLSSKLIWARAKDDKRAERSLWAGWLILHSDSLSYPEMNRAIRILGKNWKELGPLEQLELLHHLRAALPRVIERSRAELARFSPLRANTKSLLHRIESIRDWETAAVQILNLPSQALHREIFQATALLYSDFHEAIAKLPFPKSLSGEDEAAYRASLRDISQPVLEKSKQLTAQSRQASPDTDSESLRSRLQTLDYWLGLEPSLSQQNQWLDAFRNRNVPLQALVGRGLAAQSGVSTRLIQVIQAASFAAAGADAEAIALINDLTPGQ
jgi:hypothetical protein